MKSACCPDSAYAIPRASVPETPSVLVPVTPVICSRSPAMAQAGKPGKIRSRYPVSVEVLGLVHPFPFPRPALSAGHWADRSPFKHIHFLGHRPILHRLDGVMFPIPRVFGGTG